MNGFYKKFSLLRTPVRPFTRVIREELSGGMLGIRGALRGSIKMEKEKSEVITWREEKEDKHKEKEGVEEGQRRGWRRNRMESYRF